MTGTELRPIKFTLCCNTPDTSILENLRANKAKGIPTIPFTVQQHEQPLILCASGPSLLKWFPKVQRDFPNAPIMALNGAYKSLFKHFGVWADYYAQLDARAVNTNFLDIPLGPDTVFLMASQVHPDCMAKLSGHRGGMFHLNFPTTKLVFPDEAIYYGGLATIGTTAISLACGMGFRTLILLGYDSSFDNEARHADFQPQNAGMDSVDIWVEDRKYYTTGAMAEGVQEFPTMLRGLREIWPELELVLAGDGLFYDFMTTNHEDTEWSS